MGRERSHHMSSQFMFSPPVLRWLRACTRRKVNNLCWLSVCVCVCDVRQAQSAHACSTHTHTHATRNSVVAYRHTGYRHRTCMSNLYSTIENVFIRVCVVLEMESRAHEDDKCAYNMRQWFTSTSSWTHRHTNTYTLKHIHSTNKQLCASISESFICFCPNIVWVVRLLVLM